MSEVTGLKMFACLYSSCLPVDGNGGVQAECSSRYRSQLRPT
jgi:hypothetical protein